jgi:hypothetical protein
VTCSLRHELSSPRSNARIVGSNDTQGMDVCVCVYSVFVLSSMLVAALRLADPPSEESYRLCKRLGKEKAAEAQQRVILRRTIDR